MRLCPPYALQTAGLIRYSRGQIKILNRDGLKGSACECYEVIREHVDKAVPPLSCVSRAC